MNVGIEAIDFYVPKYYLNMTTLASLRNVDKDKFLYGIGQHKMSVISPLEDIITMAAEAAYDIVQTHKEDIDTILFATESGIDFSKAAGNYLHRLLGLKDGIRILELKQACYALTGALQLATDYVRMQPNKKVLVVSSDVAWYGFNTPGESTQGAGAIAMIVSKDPKIAIVNRGTFTTEELPDFYRPAFQETPTVDGKLSIDCYNSLLKRVDPQQKFTYTCFHMPFAKMANKANAVFSNPISDARLDTVKYFTQEVGNIYNGSLFLSLISVLTLAKESLESDSIGMFSYGSGAVGEFFTVDIQPGFTTFFNKDLMLKKLIDRSEIDSDTYIQFMTAYQLKEKELILTPHQNLHKSMRFILQSIENGHRKYIKR
jgi:hydroxymethylglutaryl-CoA synthase